MEGKCNGLIGLYNNDDDDDDNQCAVVCSPKDPSSPSKTTV